MDHPLAHPVNYTMVPCNDDFPAYKFVKTLAEPDVNHAADLMRKVYNTHFVSDKTIPER